MKPPSPLDLLKGKKTASTHEPDPPAPEPHAGKPLKQARRGRPLLYARPLTGAEIAKRYRAKKKGLKP